MMEEPGNTLRFKPSAAGDRPQPGPGFVLRGRYRLEQEIGRGGMGVVFRALDQELAREVAVKMLPGTSEDPKARERLLREARAAATLNHPRVVAVYDVGEDEGVPYFVMELVEGSSLEAERPADFPSIAALGGQICEALEHAHGHGLVHRDLKPSNVLLAGRQASWSVKLADLGIAAPLADTSFTRTRTLAGTPSYMAPEQALGKPLDGRADLYALGVVLYELATGRLPFTGDGPLAVVSQHVHAPVVPPHVVRAEIPRPLEAVILKLLAKDPAHRFQEARDVRDALASALLVGPSPEPEETAAAVALLEALSRGRLVGRQEEITELRELWRRTLDGRGHGVLVTGEPGAGKTRLAREIQIQAALDGATVLVGGCYEYEASTPYLPFVEAFRRWVRAEGDDGKVERILGDAAPQIAKLAPELNSRLGPFPERASLAPHEERLLFLDAVTQVLRTMGERRGLLVHLDDLQWADSGTLWLLSHLFRNLREDRVLFVGAYREIELDRAHPLAKALVDWNRERLTTRIALKRFDREETRAQIAALLGQDPSPELVSAVHTETEGNPFFVEEVIKALIEQGSILREQDRWDLCELTELAIPPSMKAAIGSRLDRVGEVCNEVLRSAAVLGKVFSFTELVAAAGDRGEDALLDALDEASAAQLVLSEGDESFAFTHDKIREVLYEELNPIRRRRLHRRTAEGLERLRESKPVGVETLAHHFVEAGDYPKGLRYAKEAAAEAERVFAYDEALASYRHALECAEALGNHEEQLVIEEAMGNALMINGEMLPARDHFERALALARDPLDRARLQTQAAGSYVVTGDEKGLDYVREAQAVFDPATHPVEAANALTIEARFHHLAGRHRKAIELLLRSAELAAPPPGAKTLGSHHLSVLTATYAYLAGAHQNAGLFRDADRWARENIAFGEKFGLPLSLAIGYEFLGEDATSLGDWRQGLEYAEREREIADRMHSRERRAWTYLVTGLCHGLLGDPARSASEFEEGLALAHTIGERRLAVFLRIFHAMFLAELDPERALEVARDNLAAAEDLGLLTLRAESMRALATVLALRREYADAVRLLEEALSLITESDAMMTRLWGGPVYIESLLALGERDRAQAFFERYETMVATCQSPHFDREVERLRRLLAEKPGDS